METDETPRVLPFQLQFDKPVASQIKIAEWNPEKDLLAMVTEDSKIVLHRFNWQRLWTISPGDSFHLIICFHELLDLIQVLRLWSNFFNLWFYRKVHYIFMLASGR